MAANEAAEKVPRDEVIAGERWIFDQEVTDVFEEMLSRSVPQYATMRQLTLDLGTRLTGGGRILDVGCSRGDALAAFADRFPEAHHRFHGLEISEPMLAAARERFADDGRVTISDWDLRRGLPTRFSERAAWPQERNLAGSFTLVLSILTLMFVPIEHRALVVRAAHDLLQPGGVLILVEKVLGATPGLDAVLVSSYLDSKRTLGYSEEQIARKRLSLEGVLVPLTAAWDEDLLRSAGFAEIDCFWRVVNFAGWIAIKGG